MLPRPSAVKRSLTIAEWTGPSATALKAFISDFTQRHPDVDVRIVYQGGAGETLARLRNEQPNPTIDIFFSTESSALLCAQGNISVPITQDLVPNIANVKEDELALSMYKGQVYWAPYWKGYVGIAINTKMYDPKVVTSWKWLWSNDLYPKKLGIPANFIYNSYTIQQVAKIWGGDEKNYEIGINKTKELAPNIGLLWSSDADSMKYLISGETPAQLTLYDDVYRAIVENPSAPIAVVVPQDAPIFAYYDVVVAVKNPPAGTDLQMLFINELLTQQANQQWTSATGTEPTIKGANPSAASQAYVGFSNQWHPDQTIVVANWSTWNDRWNKEIAPLIGT
jgi:putative spermidine/putrescine transport system substrate-binding protein